MKIIGKNGHHKNLGYMWYWGYSSVYFKLGQMYEKYDVVSYYTIIFKNIKRRNENI